MIENRLAKTLSYIFHPLLMPTYGFAILFSANTFIKHILPLMSKVTIIGILFFHTALVPAIAIFTLYKLKLVSSVELENKKDRKIPYLVSLVFYFSCYYIFKNNELPTLLHVFMFATCIVLSATYIINVFWKISAHLMGIGALTAAIYFMGIRLDVDVTLYFTMAVLIAGLLGFARLQLEAHTPVQVYIGFFAGFCIQLLIMMLFS